MRTWVTALRRGCRVKNKETMTLGLRLEQEGGEGGSGIEGGVQGSAWGGGAGCMAHVLRCWGGEEPRSGQPSQFVSSNNPVSATPVFFPRRHSPWFLAFLWHSRFTGASGEHCVVIPHVEKSAYHVPLVSGGVHMLSEACPWMNPRLRTSI